MEPSTPINEAARVNVSLSCDVLSGNPGTLLAVRWYMDGELLKELPDCSRNASTEEFCDIDPSKLLLESVGRSFHGNYSCEGRNEAGWGPTSPTTPLVVHCEFIKISLFPTFMVLTIEVKTFHEQRDIQYPFSSPPNAS